MGKTQVITEIIVLKYPQEINPNSRRGAYSSSLRDPNPREELAKKTLEELTIILEEERRKNIDALKAEADAKKIQAESAFKYWCKASYWSLKEGILLVMGKDPRGYSPKLWREIKLSIPFRDHYLLAERALEAGKLNATNSPSDFIAWAKQTDLPVPDYWLPEEKENNIDTGSKRRTPKQDGEGNKVDNQKTSKDVWGDNWNDMSILLRNDFNLLASNQITGKKEFINATDLNLVNKRTGEGKKIYEVLFKMSLGHLVEGSYRKYVSELRGELRKYFQINSDPFFEYSTSSGYKPRFKIERLEEKQKGRDSYDTKYRGKEVRYDSNEELQALIGEQAEDQKDFPNHKIK